MTKIDVGNFDARDLRVAIVVSRFNETISKRLVDGALETLARHNVPDGSVRVAWVPGAFEIPGVALRFVESGEVDAVICLGVVIRGDTPHFEYVSGQAMNGIGSLAARGDIPVICGVLTTENTEQAADRAGGKMGNKGAEAALAAIEMADLYTKLPKPMNRSDV
ncbi:MAG: 6,7-dimethyl-8-ribityllumazine synthase [Actinomycetota bacterium]